MLALNRKDQKANETGPEVPAARNTQQTKPHVEPRFHGPERSPYSFPFCLIPLPGSMCQSVVKLNPTLCTAAIGRPTFLQPARLIQLRGLADVPRQESSGQARVLSYPFSNPLQKQSKQPYLAKRSSSHRSKFFPEKEKKGTLFRTA